MTDDEHLQITWRALRALGDHLERTGRAPTWRELAAALARGPSTVRRSLDALERAGLVARDPGALRGLRLTEEGRRAYRERLRRPAS